MTRTATSSVPSITAGEGGPSRHLAEIRRIPTLQPDEEYTATGKLNERELRLFEAYRLGGCWLQCRSQASR